MKKEIYAWLIQKNLGARYMMGTVWALKRQNLFALGTQDPTGKQTHKWDM